MKNSNRKTIAIILMIVGVFGLSLAAATQLNLDWNSTFQQGTVEVTADCQGDAVVSVKFGNPVFTEDEARAWDVKEITFNNVNSACNAKNYQVAIKVGANTDWVRLEENGTVNNTTLSVLLNDVNAEDITDIALTIYGEQD